MNKWLKKLIAAAIGGSANTVTGMIIAPEVFNIHDLPKLGQMALGGAIISVAFYLAKSPLPGVTGEGDTASFKKPKIGLMIIPFLVMFGCARFSTKQSDVSYNTTGKPVRAVTTKAVAWTFFEGKSKLASWEANQTDKTQRATVGGMSQEVTATNLAVLAEKISEGVSKGMLPK